VRQSTFFVYPDLFFRIGTAIRECFFGGAVVAALIPLFVNPVAVLAASVAKSVPQHFVGAYDLEVFVEYGDITRHPLEKYVVLPLEGLRVRHVVRHLDNECNLARFIVDWCVVNDIVCVPSVPLDTVFVAHTHLAVFKGLGGHTMLARPLLLPENFVAVMTRCLTKHSRESGVRHYDLEVAVDHDNIGGNMVEELLSDPSTDFCWQFVAHHVFVSFL